MWCFYIFALAALASVNVAARPNVGHHLLHRRKETSSSFVKRDILDRHMIWPMRIGLTQGNLDHGHEWLEQVSNPASHKYGQYYTEQQIHDLFAPSEDSVAAVRRWLEAAGIDAAGISQSTNKQWIQFDAPVGQVEALLQTKYHFYEHVTSRKHSVGCDEYYVHADVQAHIDYITPGIKLLGTRMMASSGKNKRMFRGPNGFKPPKLEPLPIPLSTIIQAEKQGLLTTCDVAITPNCIAAMYNITPATLAHPNNRLGIFEDVAQYLSSTNMDLFFTAFAIQIPNGTFPILRQIDGAQNQNNVLAGTLEASLDFQTSYPIIYPQNSVLYLTDDDNYEEDYTFKGFFNTFLDGIDGSYCNYSAFGETGDSTIDPSYPDPQSGGFKGQLQCGVFKPTNVISLSYGLPEEGAGIPPSYQQRQCSEYMKLGMRGISVIFASGDDGVGSADGCLGATGNVFSPGFPANCPWVTSVGATTLPSGASASKDQEAASTFFPSGGGFSNVFARPMYQNMAVQTYFESPDAPSYPFYTGSTMGNGLCNRSGRGFPDVAAVGQDIAIFVDGLPNLAEGTSASAPIFASVLNRINEERLAIGKSTVGFVNPTLYAHPHVLHDITNGTNPNCNVDGFNATTGWDPVTGLGTPNYPAMVKLFVGLK